MNHRPVERNVNPPALMSEDSHSITRLLLEWRSGNKEAAGRLLEVVYSELYRIASREMRRERREHTLQTTALVNELYIRLCGSEPIPWQDRVHFFAVAAQQLRRVLIDYARRVRSKKRGGGKSNVALIEADGAWQFDERVLAVDQALVRLEALDSRGAKVIELRIVGGLTEAEVGGCSALLDAGGEQEELRPLFASRANTFGEQISSGSPPAPRRAAWVWHPEVT